MIDVENLSMLKKLDVPILGLVENLVVAKCPHCQGDLEAELLQADKISGQHKALNQGSRAITT